MAKQEQARMPSSQGGLVQYFEADSGFQMDPKSIIGITGGTAVIMIALHAGILVP